MPPSERYARIGIRIALSLIFINSLAGKATGFGTTTQFMASNGFFAPSLFLIVAIIIEAAGIVSLLAGYRLRQGALILVMYVFCATFIFHTRLIDPLQLAMFFKNIAIMGALGILAIEGHEGRDGAISDSRTTRAFKASRLAIALIFIVMGLSKTFQFEANRQMMLDMGLSSTDVFLSVTIAAELAGGAAVALGYRVRQAALGLIIYLIPITLIMHLDLSDVVQRIMFFKNIALMGALGLLALKGDVPGRANVEK